MNPATAQARQARNGRHSGGCWSGVVLALALLSFAGVIKVWPSRTLIRSESRATPLEFFALPLKDARAHTEHWQFCQRKNVVEFTEAQVIHNNLGGLGPSSGATTLVFRNVLPRSNRVVNLQVAATSPYVVLEPQRNGLNQSIGQIRVQSGMPVNFTFRFVDDASREVLQLKGFHMSFFSLDRGVGNESTMDIAVHGLSEYHLSNSTQVVVRRNETSSTTFAATGSAVAPQAPLRPMHLTDLQKQQALSVLFTEASEFSVTYSATGSHGGADLLFSGASSLVCPEVEMCSALVCPSGFHAKPDAASIACSGSHCAEKDIAICCFDAALCAEEVVEFQDASVVHNNLDLQGPTNGDPSLTIKNVVPARDEPVNLEIFATSPYRSADSGLNGVNERLFGQVNVKSGTSVDLVFRFVDDATWKPVQLKSFYFSVFDLDQENGGACQEQVEIAGFKQFNLSADTDVKVKSDGAGSFFFSGSSVASDIEYPLHPLTLTKSQRKRAVSFLFSQMSSFYLTFRVGPGRGGRNFLFSGVSPLVCPTLNANEAQAIEAQAG